LLEIVATRTAEEMVNALLFIGRRAGSRRARGEFVRPPV
jgi:hypothetical protein